MNLPVPVPVATIVLLILSNVFMTFAWYGHLRYKALPLLAAIVISWGIAFFEYLLQVPANRVGYGYFSAAELKAIQEIISLSVFAFFSTLYLGESLRWNHLVGFSLIVLAAFFIFKRLCHNKQLINSHFYRGVSELPYKLLFAVIYTHLEFRYEVSHTITSHHVHHFHQTRIPDGTLLDYMVQYRKPLFPQFFLYPKKFLPENNPHHKEFHLRPYIQNNANQ